MSTESTQAYGFWWLVTINSLVFIIFAFRFAKPQSARDWRSLGAFSAFIVAPMVVDATRIFHDHPGEHRLTPKRMVDLG